MRSFLFVFVFLIICHSIAETVLCGHCIAESDGTVIGIFQTLAFEPNRYGNLVFALSGDEFRNSVGKGDVVAEVTFLTSSNTPIKTISLPVSSSIASLNVGDDVLICPFDASRPLTALRYYGSFAEVHQLAFRTPTNTWKSVTGTFPIGVKIRVRSVFEGGESTEVCTEDSLFYSTNRFDYANLTDEDFANFRVIEPQTLFSGKVYRASSPINAKYGRSDVVDALCRSKGIRTIWNLADAPYEAAHYPGYSNRYVSTCITLHTPVGIDPTSTSFREAVSNGISFLKTNPPPYLIHCNEGKDRTGLIAALIERASGATLKEIADDYTRTFQNYYNNIPIFATNNILQLLHDCPQF